MVAHPAAALEPGCAVPVRAAFYGKTGSADKAQLSLHRQLHAVSRAVPGNTRICCYFADIGVWTAPPEEPATGEFRLNGHPVLGGLTELLHRAAHVPRGFDVVVCFDESRLPRRMADRLAVEDTLAECGVGIVAITNTSGGTLDPRVPMGRYWPGFADGETSAGGRSARLRPHRTAPRRGIPRDGVR